MFLFVICLLALLAAMLLSAVLTWAVRGVARKNRWTKGPQSDRHVHSQPIPRLGGVAVYATFIALIFIETAVVSYGLHLHRPESTRLLLRVLLPATLMFLTGLVDDIWGMPAVAKLGMQILAGFWLYESGGRVSVLVHTRTTDFTPILSCICTIVWVVMLCNAFNLIDGLDGLAAGASVFPLLTFSAVAIIRHNGQMGVGSIILIGALLGFLRFNFNPATIFLGDCGSLFLGFMLAALSLIGNQAKAPTLLSVALPVVACAFPIAETFVSVVRRFLSGKPIFSPDREHIHHRLMHLGFTHRQVVILLFAVSGMCSLMSVILIFPKLNAVALVAIALCLLVVVGIAKLGYPEFQEIGRVIQRASQQKLVIANNVKIRQLATLVERAHSWDDVTRILAAGLNGGDFSGFELGIYEPNAFRDSPALLIYSRKVAMRTDFDEMSWNLTLHFASGGCTGFLDLRSPYKTLSLMVDVNVLLQVLKPALSSACEAIGVAAGAPFEAEPRVSAKRVSAGD